MKKNPDLPSNFVSSLALYSVLLRESSTPYPDRRTLLSAGSCCYTHTTISMCTLKISPLTRVHPHIHTQICSLPCSPPVWHKLYRTKAVMDMIMIIFLLYNFKLLIYLQNVFQHLILIINNSVQVHAHICNLFHKILSITDSDSPCAHTWTKCRRTYWMSLSWALVTRTRWKFNISCVPSCPYKITTGLFASAPG